MEIGEHRLVGVIIVIVILNLIRGRSRKKANEVAQKTVINEVLRTVATN